MSYFGDVFQLLPAVKKDGDKQKMDKVYKHNTDVLRVLGTIRQQTMHFEDISFFFDKNLKEKFRNKKFSDENDNWNIIKQNYGNLIERINRGFIQHSAVNLNILFEMYAAKKGEDRKRITEEYYRFSILKEGKNLGVNMKKIRELIIDTYCPGIKDKKKDSYRAKLYTIADYVLFRELRSSQSLEKMVEKLRLTSDEDAKDKLYQEFSKTAWEKMPASKVRKR